jgi:NAD(P)-dependent dehydrogenase (short-subunit alcohol dehydrogenase family)
MEEEFANRIAVVTGASSGIGRATAELLAARGARVAVFARSREKLHELAAARADRMLAVPGDAADEESIEKLFDETERRFGPCQILVNNAGMIDPDLLVNTTTDRWDRLFDVNVRSAFLTCRRALPRMMADRSGAIVNVSSISGVIGPEKFAGYVSYCASKAALIGFTEALAAEVREHGVRVNCISPGSVDTKMWARAGGGAPADMTPEEVAESILFLASSRSRPISVQNLHVYSV